jgi:hypothetical protein
VIGDAVTMVVGRLGPSIVWDPAPLPENWWLPHESALPFRRAELGAAQLQQRRPGRTCARIASSGSHTTLFAVHGPRAGGLNNRLILLMNAVQLIATQDPPSRLLVSLDIWPTGDEILDSFDLREATRTWTCVLLHVPAVEQARPYRLQPQELFRVLHNSPATGGALSAGRLFYEGFMSQLMLRPSAVLRSYVEWYEALHGLDRAPVYAAVHLRLLEGDCFRKNSLKSMRVRMLPRFRIAGGARNMTLADICRVSDDYLDAWFERLGVPAGAPVVVGTDAQAQKRLNQLRQRYNILVPSEDHAELLGARTLLPGGKRIPAVLIDMLLMMRATAFVGNPQSTLSYNIAAVRANQLENPRQNILRNVPGQYPLPEGWKHGFRVDEEDWELQA